MGLPSGALSRFIWMLAVATGGAGDSLRRHPMPAVTVSRPTAIKPNRTERKIIGVVDGDEDRTSVTDGVRGLYCGCRISSNLLEFAPVGAQIPTAFELTC